MSFPEAEVMRSLSSKVVKNNQITYGMPYQIRIPYNLQRLADQSMLSQNIEDTVSSHEFHGEDEPLPSPEEILEQARKECDILLNEAQQKADQLLEQTIAEAERKSRELQEEAWQKGYAAGVESANTQYEAILGEAERIRESASQEHDAILASLESEVLELVMKITRKALAGELATNKEIIIQLVQDSLPGCSNKTGAVLKVSPADHDYLNQHIDQLCETVEGADELEIKRDSTLKPGDCIIETQMGSVDAGVNTRLEKIEEAFREELEGK